MATNLDPLEALPALPASDVKKRGWRGVTRALAARGAIVVTNHEQPEAVILPAQQYAALVAAARQEAERVESALEDLRRRFDDRLAVLQAPGAGARLRAAARSGPRLRGKVKAGDSF
jgi:PHD/YefM family antitoxin component YafN of YafNO toxin-antitoxin module